MKKLGILLLLLIGVIFISLGIHGSKNLVPEYSYAVQKNTDYSVLLKPNDFYENESLPQNRYYVSNSIDNFNINFKYNFKGERKTNLSYNYIVVATLIGKANTEEGNLKEVWEKSFNLMNEDVPQNLNDSNYLDSFSLEANTNINYGEYLALVNAFEEQYNVPISAVLKLEFNVKINFYDLNVNDIEDKIELEIPIKDTITSVQKNYENTNSNSIMPQEEGLNVKASICYIIGGTAFVLAIIAIFMQVKKSKKEKNLNDLYEKNMTKILKNYGELIVTVENEPNIKNLEILNVRKLEDLIDLAEQTKSNIICYEILKNKKSKFYVILGKYAYIYEI